MTDEITSNVRNGFLNYIDILVAVMNFSVILITLIIFQKNFFISLFGGLLSGVLILFLIYTFIKNNPFYDYYFLGLVICGFLFAISSSMVPSWLWFVLFFDILYFYKIYRSMVQHPAVTTMAKGRFLRKMGNRGLSVRNGRNFRYS